MISAEIANSYHKEVFAVPGRPDDKQSEGCNYLIKTHKAALAECAEDIAYQMLWDEAGAQAGVQQLLFTELSPEEKIIVDLLRQAEAMHVDNLVVKAGLNYSVLAASLLNLECQGIIKSLPGSRYRLLTR
jgi:DNA processing protein